MKVQVNREACISCGICVTECPEIFELDDEEIAVVKLETIPAALEDCVRNASDSCAVEAIGEEKLHPSCCLPKIMVT